MIANATTAVVKQSPRLATADEAIALLDAYVTNKGDAADLADWK